MITAIIRNKENTLVLELPHSIYDIYEKLQSIGIMQPPKQIPLTDNEDEDIGVKLFSESDFGRHLLLTLNEKNSIADANIFILPPSMAINMPHSSYTAFVSTETGWRRLPRSACSDTWLVSSKTAWRMSAEAEKTASTASCGEKLRRKNRLTDSSNSTGRLRIHFMRNLLFERRNSCQPNTFTLQPSKKKLLGRQTWSHSCKARANT